MSLKKFLTKLWFNVKSLLSGFPPSIKEAVHIGVTVAENIKLFIDSPGADVITAIIPGTIDDKIKTLLKSTLPELLERLKLIDESINLPDANQKIKFAIQNLQHLNTDIKNTFYHTLSVLVAQLISGKKLTWSDGVGVVEWYYQHKFKTN